MDKKAARERKKLLFNIENLLEGPMIAATLATLFVGSDAEEVNAPVAGAKR